MPHISEMRESKFLKKEDCGAGILVTVSECVQENTAKEGAPQEYKWCLRFHEQEKPMVLNATNMQIIAAICGSENTDDWIGKKVVLYSDPNISFQGKLVGGIRARAPKNPAARPPAAPPANGRMAQIPSRPVQQPVPAPNLETQEFDSYDIPF